MKGRFDNMERKVEKTKKLNVVALELGLTSARGMCLTYDGGSDYYKVDYKNLKGDGADTSLKILYKQSVSEILKHAYQDTKQKKMILLVSVPVIHAERAMVAVSKLKEEDLKLCVETQEGSVELEIVKIDIVPNAPVPGKIDIGNPNTRTIDFGPAETMEIGGVSYQVSMPDNK